jgi:hypothetical protein
LLNTCIFAGRLHSLYLEQFKKPLSVQVLSWYKEMPRFEGDNQSLLEFFRKGDFGNKIPRRKEIKALKCKAYFCSF